MSDHTPHTVTVEYTEKQADALREIGQQRVEEVHGNRLRPDPDWVEELKQEVDPAEVVTLLVRDAIREEMTDE